MGFLKRVSDNSKPNSLANKLRSKRFAWFKSVIKPLKTPLGILDVGGTSSYWEILSAGCLEDFKVETLNLAAEDFNPPVVKSHAGDARDLGQFSDKQFDLVFSNSVIEHVGDFEQQKRMAREIIRVGSSYIIQTPNFYFPMEPHFLFPFFQFLPRSFRASLVKNFRLGWTEKASNTEEAYRLVDSVTLLKEEELKNLFPDALIHREKFLGLTKSLTAYKIAA